MIDPSRFRYPERAIVFLAVCYLVVGCAYVAGLGAGDSAACREPFPPPIRLGKLPMYSTITMVNILVFFFFHVLFIFNFSFVKLSVEVLIKKKKQIDQRLLCLSLLLLRPSTSVHCTIISIGTRGIVCIVLSLLLVIYCWINELRRISNKIPKNNKKRRTPQSSAQI